jgi:protein TorT
MEMTMPRVKARAAAAVLAASALLLAACGGSSDSDRTSKYDSSKPIPGSTEGSFKATGAEIREGLKKDAWWYPTLFVDCDDKAADKSCNTTPTEGVYNAIPKDHVSKTWKICFVVPHVTDQYWVAADFGAVTESKRLGVDLDVYEAGGYSELSKQLNQIDDCVAGGAEAVVIGANSAEGVSAKVDELVKNGIVVIDGLNGIANAKVQGRAVLNWYEMGGAAGKYLAERGSAAKVGWFPGPPGLAWAEASTKGFSDAVKGSKVSLGSTKYGNTDKDSQLKLVEDTLQSDPNINVIAGNAVAAEAAVGVRGNRKYEIIADYLIPSTLDAIKSGDITCGISDQPVIQARMAIDMAVRLLEKIPLDDKMRRAAPAPITVCGPAAGDAANVEDFITETTFAPAGFKPVFSVRGK